MGMAKTKPITYTLRIEAKVNGRQAAAYEIDVESITLLQALINSAQDGMQVAIDSHEAEVATAEARKQVNP